MREDVLTTAEETRMREIHVDAIKSKLAELCIDATHNLPLLNRFEQNVRCSAELYSDADRDGRVSAADTRLASCPPEP